MPLDWLSNLITTDSPRSPADSVDRATGALIATLYRDIKRFEASGESTLLFDPLDAFFLPFTGFRGVARPGPNITIWQRRR